MLTGEKELLETHSGSKELPEIIKEMDEAKMKYDFKRFCLCFTICSHCPYNEISQTPKECEELWKSDVREVLK